MLIRSLINVEVTLTADSFFNCIAFFILSSSLICVLSFSCRSCVSGSLVSLQTLLTILSQHIPAQTFVWKDLQSLLKLRHLSQGPWVGPTEMMQCEENPRILIFFFFLVSPNHCSSALKESFLQFTIIILNVRKTYIIIKSFKLVK